MDTAEPGRRATRQSKKDMRQLTRQMLRTKLPEDDSLREELAAHGLDPTGAGVVILGQLNKAAKGDTAAAKFLKERAEERPEEIPETGCEVDLSTLSDRQLMAMLGQS